MTTVAIIEDDTQIREGIQKYLNHQKDFLCEISVESVENFLAKVKGMEFPQAILMDIGLPGMSGISGMRLIKEKQPDVDIIMLTVYTDWQKIFDSLCAGASGYLLKNTPLAEIKKGIESVRSGGAAMSPEIARKVMEYFTPKSMARTVTSPAGEDAGLTPREKEIVIGLVDGLSYKMIADRMSISIDTIRFHIKNIYKKLQVNSKAEVISKSLRGEI
jgi:DNA-binding NarL/FixJ family response regulator